VADRRFLAGFVLLSLAAFSQHPASAQSMMDREGPPPRAHAATISSQAEVLRAAACVARTSPSQAGAVLASVPGSAEERRIALALLRAGERCLHLARPLATSVELLRGAAAESLYEAQFAAPVAARTPAVAVAPIPRPSRAAGAADPDAFRPVADCVAATRQDLIRALLAADPGTPAEQAALRHFDPVFAACTPPGARLQVESGALRGLLAEALYRWSVVQRDGPGAPRAGRPRRPPRAEENPSRRPLSARGLSV
jgi:hypothetical protein